MTEVQTRGVVRHLGGESGHRSFFGGQHSKSRVAALAVAFVSGIILTPLIGWPGLLVGGALAGGTLLVTARTHRGSVLDRRRRRRRWSVRVRSGTDAFVPYDATVWADANQVLADAAGRKARWFARRDVATIRAMPDGADGMGWLQMGVGLPGIAWHAPVGEEPYLSVVFGVSGQLHGIESTTTMRRAAEGWGMFLAQRAVPSDLVGGVQTLTRILPSDTALHEFWVLNSLDPSAPPEAISSYDEVLRLTGADAMVQRHYIVVRWPINTTFQDEARKYADGRDGWRQLMSREIDATVRGLTEARMGEVVVLTARQVAAVIHHQQDPNRPIDYVADIDPTRLGILSHDEFSTSVTETRDPGTGQLLEWWHRTARVSAENLATAPREQLWVLDLLVGRDLPFIRSVSFHLQLIPAAEAKAAARRDLIRDAAEVISKRQDGQIDTDETTLALGAARRRSRDLIAGSHHHGTNWVGYITITTRGRDELARASRQLEDTCSSGLGIERLDWLDSYQAAATGTTWPIGRGIAPHATTLSARLYRRLAGRTDKDTL
jgi:hypothetical protein